MDFFTNEIRFVQCKGTHNGHMACQATFLAEDSEHELNENGQCRSCDYSEHKNTLKTMSLETVGKLGIDVVRELVCSDLIPLELREKMRDVIPCVWCGVTYTPYDDMGPRSERVNKLTDLPTIPICRRCENKVMFEDDDYFLVDHHDPEGHVVRDVQCHNCGEVCVEGYVTYPPPQCNCCGPYESYYCSACYWGECVVCLEKIDDVIDALCAGCRSRTVL